MSSTWTPPPDGVVCWINIFATDVLRGPSHPLFDKCPARDFYKTALGWKFRESTTRMDGTEEDPTQIVHFELGSNCPGGGITKVDQVVKTEGKGGQVLYLYFENGLADVAKKILSAGGKKMTEVEPEGKSAFHQHFEDTEGNYFGIYSSKK